MGLGEVADSEGVERELLWDKKEGEVAEIGSEELHGKRESQNSEIIIFNL